MKINTKSKNKFYLSLILFLLLACSVIFAMHHYQVGFFQPKNESNIQKTNLQKPSKDQVSAGEKAKDDFGARTTEASQERQVASGESAPVAEDKEVQTIISSSNVNGATISIRSIIQTIDASGTCSLTLTRSGSQNVTKTVNTTTMGSYTTCAGFDIDTTGMAKGEWEIKLIYSGSAGQSGSATKMVTL